ncbi:MAG: DNA mismatch repair endonuclease MutL [Syntrophales bacterium]|nr:DNA mismatch repair endonuclease MutL [Syntrophales bacterium]MDY0043535.1 DNA mismatch repair endonuclease MutL [Syntrophales bacterium]
MKGKIIKMTQELSSKIAAGEVVERPASIIKELLENSIDAGATEIEVDLEEGGNRSIQIRDNGHGIDAQDVALAFERHATSKISSFEDLYHIESLGFRGEALNSVAAVCRVELTTRTKEAIAGTKVIIEGGKIKEHTDAGCPEGTAVKVSDIFFNTPVRKKFMKKEKTEHARCLEIILRLALAVPNIRFRISSNGKTILNIQKTDTVEEKIALVLGGDFRNQSLPLTVKKEDMRLHGLIGRPTFTRANGTSIITYINNRFVRDGLINQAVMAAYRPVIESGRYPVAVIFIDLPPEQVDVNVHPAKREVRFRDARTVFGFVTSGIAGCLADSVPGHPGIYKETQARTSDFDYRSSIKRPLAKYTISSDTKRIFEPRETAASVHRVSDNSVYEVPDAFRTQISFSEIVFLGQIAGTYLVFSAGDRMILIDQHAAHERIVFEKLKSKISNVQYQRLLLPEIADLSPSEYLLFIQYRELFNAAGFENEIAGHNAVSITAVPSILSGVQVIPLVHDIIEEIDNVGKNLSLETIKDKVFAFIACRSAVKAHQILGEEEVAFLCKDLDSIPNNATCPHGRPTYIVIEKQELERMFKRR